MTVNGSLQVPNIVLSEAGAHSSYNRFSYHIAMTGGDGEARVQKILIIDLICCQWEDPSYGVLIHRNAGQMGARPEGPVLTPLKTH